MGHRVPFPYLEVDDPAFKEKLRRDFAELEKYADAAPTTGYDAIVTAGSTDNDTTRTYSTVYSAITHLDNLGFVTARIGVSARGGTITETVSLGAMSILQKVEIVAVDGGGTATTYMNGTKWAQGAFSMGTSLHNITIRGMTITVGAGRTSLLGASGGVLVVDNCLVDGTGVATSTTCLRLCPASNQQCIVINSSLIDIDTSLAYIYSTLITFATTTSIPVNGGINWYNCFVQTQSSARTMVFAGGGSGCTMVGCSFQHFGPSGSGSTSVAFTISSTGARDIYIVGTGDVANISPLALSVSGHANLVVQADGSLLTVGAPVAGGKTYVSGRWDNPNLSTIADITGPGRFDIVTGQTVILRGAGLLASIKNTFILGGASVALQGVAVTDSTIIYNANLATASATQKPYTFDASSLRCLVLMTGKNAFPTAGTNSGTNVFIVDESGFSLAGAVGGVLTGTLPNPGMAASGVTPGSVGGAASIPTFTVTADGRITVLGATAVSGAGIDSTALHTSDTAETSWTPSFTASPSSPVLGVGGTIGGIYQKYGKRVTATVSIHFGTSAFNPGSGTWTIGLPSTTDSGVYVTNRHVVGTWSVKQGSSGTVYSGQCRLVGTSATTMVLNVSTGGSVTADEASVGPAGAWPAGTDITCTIEYFEV